MNFGLSLYLMSAYTPFKSIISRIILKPPDVDPPLPPTNMSMRHIHFENVGHVSKSTVTNPVVEDSDDVVKNVS